MRILRLSSFVIGGLLLAPLVLLVLGLRPALRPGWRERLGRIEPPTSGRVWVHAASLGEAQIGIALIERLEASGVACFATAVSEAGREALGRRLARVPHAHAPIDHPFSVARAFDRIQPRALVLVETELWPFLIGTAFVRGVPVYLVSGRISDRSLPRYRRLRGLWRPLLSRLSGVAARTAQDAERFIELGARPERVCVLGDLKRDPQALRGRVAADLVRALDGQPVCVAGSTHDGEEAALLDALSASEARGTSAVLVLAPRRLERVGAVMGLVESRGRRVVRRSRSTNPRLCPGDVLVLDTMGELAALYAVADVAFVGGTLARIGGHNVLEPVVQGAPVIFGPHLENVRENAEWLLESGAAVCVADASALSEAVFTLLHDPKDARARGRAGRDALLARGGAVRATERWLVSQLQGVGS